MSDPQSQDEINEAEWLNAANWRYGLFYHSERDSRPWVPKRSLFGRRRFGGTPNFAKKTARQYLMLVMGVMVLLFVVVVWLERLGILR